MVEILFKQVKDKFFHMDMLMRLLEIKLDQATASNEELDKMIEYFKAYEEYEYCNVLKDKKCPGTSPVFETGDV